MSSTIDNINTCILNKLNYLLTATKILLDYTLEDVDYNKVIDIQNKLEELQTNYELGSLNIVNDYNTLTDQQYKITTTIVPKKMQRITIDEPINDDNNDDNDDDDNDDNDDNDETESAHISSIQKPVIITSHPIGQQSPDFIEQLNKIYKQYAKFINSENINSTLNRYHKTLAYMQKIYNIQEIDLVDSLSYYLIGDINMDSYDNEQFVCACGYNFDIEAKTSEKKCANCGNSEKIFGIVFEDDQFFYQEGQRTKHGKYDPTKHCKFWLDCIQAKENTDIPEKIIIAIKKCIKRDSVWLDKLTCKIIRKYLKELKHTNYNDHAPLIKKVITEKEPSILTEHECRRVYIIFSRVVQIYNRIKPDNKPNCPYHPYFIYKIIEQLLKEPIDAQRRTEILQSIHLQSRDTLIDNDNIWKPICDTLNKDFLGDSNNEVWFTYTPTESY